MVNTSGRFGRSRSRAARVRNLTTENVTMLRGIPLSCSGSRTAFHGELAPPRRPRAHRESPGGHSTERSWGEEKPSPTPSVPLDSSAFEAISSMSRTRSKTLRIGEAPPTRVTSADGSAAVTVIPIEARVCERPSQNPSLALVSSRRIMFETITHHIDDGILTITLNRPDKSQRLRSHYGRRVRRAFSARGTSGSIPRPHPVLLRT